MMVMIMMNQFIMKELYLKNSKKVILNHAWKGITWIKHSVFQSQMMITAKLKEWTMKNKTQNVTTPKINPILTIILFLQSTKKSITQFSSSKILTDRFCVI